MKVEKPVLCFGELLLRMSPLPDAKWIDEAAMKVYIGGAECNVAAALAAWQAPVQYVTALPENILSEDICKTLSAKGIDVSPIRFSGSRIGIYYLMQGTDLKHTGVTYDRAHSSFSELQPGLMDWEALLENVKWFHFSAISPALNRNIALVCREAIAAAKNKNITISVDLNHRAKLWQWGKHPVDVMPELVENCDIVMGNIWSANALLGIPIDEHIHQKQSKEAYLQQANETAIHLMKRFSQCKVVAQTFRFDNNEGVRYYASFNNVQHQYVSKEYRVEKVVDKVGSGDCFMAGLIYGLINNDKPQQTIDFATAAAIGKMNEMGDSTTNTLADVTRIMTRYE